MTDKLSSIDWISVEGFRSIARLERLPLRPINILIGANGSGKSNLIQVFALLRALRLGRLNDYVGRSDGADRNLHFGSKTTKEMRIDISFGGEEEKHHAVFEPTDADELQLRSEWMKAPSEERGREGDIEKGITELIRERLDRWRVYHFHDTGRGSPLFRTAQLHDNRFLREDGENLAAFLYYLKQKEQASYRRIKQTFRLVAPFFGDFILEPQALNEQMIRLEWRHRTSDAHFDISTFSDGSLRFLALATLLLQPTKLQPSVILLDEPELGLHPYAITLLCSLISSVATETQVILATQSSFLVDHFEPEDVIVVDRVEGRSEFKRLSTEKLKNWLEDHSLGDLWLMNDLGGRPSYEHSAQEDN